MNLYLWVSSSFFIFLWWFLFWMIPCPSTKTSIISSPEQPDHWPLRDIFTCVLRLHCHHDLIVNHVGKTIVNHPPVISIFIGSINHSRMGDLWHCFTHIIDHPSAEAAVAPLPKTSDSELKPGNGRIFRTLNAAPPETQHGVAMIFSHQH